MIVIWDILNQINNVHQNVVMDYGNLLQNSVMMETLLIKMVVIKIVRLKLIGIVTVKHYKLVFVFSKDNQLFN